MASNSQINGATILWKTGGTPAAFAAIESGTITRTANLLDVTGTADNNFRNVKVEQLGWEVSPAGLHVIGSTRVTGCPVVYAEATLDDTNDQQVAWVQSAQLQYTLELEEIQDCSAGTWRSYVPGKRSWTATLVYSHYDYNGTGHVADITGQKEIIDAYEGRTSIDIKIVASDGAGSPTTVTFEATGYVTNLARTAGTPTAIVTTTATIEINGAMTIGSNSETALATVITDITAASAATETEITVSGASGDEEYEGNAYCTSLTLGWNWNANSQMTATFTGNGALTRQTTT